ncbi:MAG TPA: DUF2946 family protein [Caldimonas sp.]
MDRFRRRLKALASIALVAFVGLALAPTISRALLLGDSAPPHGAGSEQQMAGMAPAHHHHGHDHQAGFTPPPPAEHRHSLDHCAMCLVAGCAFAFDATPQAFAVQDVGREHVTLAASVVPRWNDDWSPATSRGPPFIA